MQSGGDEREWRQGPRRLFLNDHGARDPRSPLHPQSPLRSLSAARRRSLSASRECAESERLLVRSVSPHESFGGRGAGVVRTLETRGRTSRGSPRGFRKKYGGDAATPPRRRPTSAQLHDERCVVSGSIGPPKDALDARAGRPHTAPRWRPGSPRQEEEEDRLPFHTFQRHLRMSEANVERRRGYFASLGSKAPGAPLHPSFDSVGTSPAGSPRRTLSPASTLSSPPLSASRAISPRLELSALSRTASLPTGPARADSRGREVTRDHGTRRPSSARYGSNIKRYWNSDGARQPGTSLHPRQDSLRPDLSIRNERKHSDGDGDEGRRQECGETKERSRHGQEANSSSLASAKDASKEKYWVDEGARRPGSPLHPAHKTQHFPRAPSRPRQRSAGNRSMLSGSDSVENGAKVSSQHGTDPAELTMRGKSPRINVFANRLGGMQPNTPLSPSVLSPRSSQREGSTSSICNGFSEENPVVPTKAANEGGRFRRYAVGGTVAGERRPGSPLHPATPHPPSRPSSARSLRLRPSIPTKGEGGCNFIQRARISSDSVGRDSVEESAKEQVADYRPEASEMHKVNGKTSELIRALVSSKASRRRDLEELTESLQLGADCRDIHLREVWRVQEENAVAHSWHAFVMHCFGARGGVKRHSPSASSSRKTPQSARPSGLRSVACIDSNVGQEDVDDVGPARLRRMGGKIWQRLVDSGWSSSLQRVPMDSDRASVNLFDGAAEAGAEHTVKRLHMHSAPYTQKIAVPPYRYS